MHRKTFYLFCLLFLIEILVPLQAQSLELEDFLADLHIRDVSISPNGKYLAAVKDKGRINYVSVRDLESPDFPEIGYWEGDIIRPAQLKWASDERLLVDYAVPVNTRKVVEKSEKEEDFDISDYVTFSRTIAVNPDGSDGVYVFNDKITSAIESNLSSINNYLPNDPDHVIMNAYSGQIRSLFKVNVHNGESELIVKGDTLTYAFVSDGKGNIRFKLDYLYVRKAVDIYEYKEQKEWEKVERIYLDDDEEETFDINNLVGIYKDDLVFIKRNKETGFNEMLARDSNSGKNRVLASLPDQDVVAAVKGWRSTEVVGYSYEVGDAIEIQYFDENLQKYYNKIRDAVRSFTSSGFSAEIRSPDARRVLVTTTGASDPGTVFLYDLEANQLTFYGTVFEKLVPDNLAVSAVTNYQTRDNAVIRAYILLPRNYEIGKKAPMIMLPHGGPHSRNYSYFNGFAQLLASRGYIVFSPNFRGSTGYGKEFLEQGFREWGGLMQDDLEDGVHFMVKKGLADPNNICIVGGSYGGYAALMGVVKTPDLYKCAVSINGVSDLLDLAKSDQKKFRNNEDVLEQLQTRIGHPSKDKDRLKKQSPINHVEEIRVPVLIIAGSQDERVPYSQSTAMVKALEKADKKVEFLKIEGAGHDILNRRRHAEETYRKVVSFLEKHLD